MARFRRDDGRELTRVKGFRQRLLHIRPSTRPKPHWEDSRYAEAGKARRAQWERHRTRLEEQGVGLAGAKILELGCGGGVYGVQFALASAAEVVGVDSRLSLFDASPRAVRQRRLLAALLRAIGVNPDPWTALCQLPLLLLEGDATRLPFEDGRFDLVFSNSVLEHVRPVEEALDEVARVLRPGGVAYHAIEPFYGSRGCHKPGLVDLPWAHARLTPAEYRRFVAETEGDEMAAKRSAEVGALNALTLARWRELFEAGPLELFAWSERRDPFADALESEFPEVLETLLPGVRPVDVQHDRIYCMARKPG